MSNQIEHLPTSFLADRTPLGLAELPDAWPRARALLLPAISRTGGRLSADSVFAYISTGHYQLWYDGMLEVAMVTEFRTYPTMLRSLNVLLIGGKSRKRWFHLWPQVERWAAKHGCSKVEFTGRRGWLRILSDWKLTTVDMEKDLLHG